MLSWHSSGQEGRGGERSQQDTERKWKEQGRRRNEVERIELG
jgi:hypothetical protein